MPFPSRDSGVGEVLQTQTLTIRQGDRLPSIVVQVIDEFNEAVALTGQDAYLAIRRIESGDGGDIWNDPIQTLILDEAQGIVSYDWQLVNTEAALPGTYEFVVNLVDRTTGKLDLTVPTTRDTFIAIRPSVVEITTQYLTDAAANLLTDSNGDYLTTSA